MKDLGCICRFLGIEVDENYGISQKEYINEMPYCFGMENANQAQPPWIRTFT
jgi:hypothetical protein